MIEQMGGLLNSSAVSAAADGAWAVYATVGVAFFVGLALWLVGGRAMRPALGAVGMAAGAGIGLIIGEAGGEGVETWVATGTGALAGLVFGLVLFRLTMALTLGGVLGVLAPLAAATLIHFYGSPLGESGGGGEASAPGGEERESDFRSLFLDDVPIVEGLEQARDLSERGREALAGQAREGGPADRAAGRIGRFAGALGAELEPLWERLPVRDRMLLVLSMVTGVAMGMAIGMILPRSAAALIASGAGAGMWLASGTWLATSVGVIDGDALPKRAAVWLGVWGVAWVGGAIFQFLVLGRKRREPGE